MHVLIIEPAFACLALLHTSKKLGHRVSVISADTDDRIIPFEYRHYIDHLVVSDTDHVDTLLVESRKLDRTHKIDGVIPGSEYHVCLTAIVAHDLHLIGHCIDTVEALRNKFIMRELLKHNDIRMPKYALIRSEHSLISAAETTGFPAVLKPTSMAGGLNVRKVNHLAELKDAYLSITHCGVVEMGHSCENGVVLESYINGKMYSIEGFITQNQSYIVSITEKFQCAEPYFIEIGHIVQANLTEEVKKRLCHYVHKVLKSLKMVVGVFHLELKVDQDGPAIIEIAGRLPGCRIVDLIRLAQGVDLVEIMIKTHLNERVSQPVLKGNTAGIQFFSVPKGANQYSVINGWGELKNIPTFYESTITISAGTVIDHPDTFQGRVAHAIFYDESYDKVALAMLRAKELIRIN